MEIVRNLKVPTGNILVVKGDKGNLECLSLGDYGKDVNLKADCLGLSRPLDKVEHTKLLPLTKKVVITISTQYGCSMGCKFCDVPKVGPGVNATLKDLYYQVHEAIFVNPQCLGGERLNIHFARMGEPTFNPHVLQAAKLLRSWRQSFKVVHPVVSTMMPEHNDWLIPFLREWMYIKNDLYKGDAGLQLSINSTDEWECFHTPEDKINNREVMFNHNSMDIQQISGVMANLPKPVGRKITLNFAVGRAKIEGRILRNLFDPEYFVCKLTPMHKTKTALDNDIKTDGDYTTIYPYQEIEEDLKKHGFDVIVFIASKEEDLGRITCGNAILSGTLPEVSYEEVK